MTPVDRAASAATGWFRRDGHGRRRYDPWWTFASGGDLHRQTRGRVRSGPGANRHARPAQRRTPCYGQRSPAEHPTPTTVEIHLEFDSTRLVGHLRLLEGDDMNRAVCSRSPDRTTSGENDRSVTVVPGASCPGQTFSHPDRRGDMRSGLIALCTASCALLPLAADAQDTPGVLGRPAHSILLGVGESTNFGYWFRAGDRTDVGIEGGFSVAEEDGSDVSTLAASVALKRYWTPTESTVAPYSITWVSESHPPTSRQPRTRNTVRSAASDSTGFPSGGWVSAGISPSAGPFCGRPRP
jgi:hypothetical protein